MKSRLTLTAAALVTLTFSASLLSGCASQLKRDKKINTPVGSGVEEKLDLSSIFFTDLYSGTTFSIAEYMEAEGKDHLLLMFGSKGCTSCNQKNEHFKESIIGRHQFLLTNEGKRFDLIGVNTDIEPAERMRSYLLNYEFIRWSDPKGQNMVNFFVPPGRSFGVPVTVLLNRRGIVFRILNDEKATPEEIMARVEEAILGGSGNPGASPVKPTPQPTPPVVVPATDLAFIGPGRFKKVEVASCDGAKTSLDRVLGEPDFRVVHVVKGGCSSACEKNTAELKALSVDVCGVEGRVAGSKKCAAVVLQTEAPVAGSQGCSSGLAYKGGDLFFDVFETHFNWNQPRVLDEDDFLPRFTGDFATQITMVFRRDGALVWSHAGELATGALASALKAPGFGTSFATGPKLPVYTKTQGSHYLGDVIKQSRITVLSTSQIANIPPCSGCLEEMQMWSQQGSLVDYCAARASECQVRFVEIRDNSSFTTLDNFYDFVMAGGTDPDPAFPGTVTGLNGYGVRIPLLVDPLAKYTDEGDNFARIHEGYLTAMSRRYFETNKLGNPLVTIFNQEGRIVEMYLSGDPDHDASYIFERVKNLLKSQ